MKNIRQLTLTGIFSLGVLSAQAHPGHDHSSWTALPIHLLYYGSILAMILFAAYLAYRISKRIINGAPVKRESKKRTAIYSLLKKVDEKVGIDEAKAHCDIPCGIYDPMPAQIAALSVLRFLHQASELGDNLEDRAKLVRLVQMKEEHAEKVKHEIRIIWGDYVKGDILNNNPELTQLCHDIMICASACKQGMHIDNGQKLIELVNQFAEKFWATKKVASYRAICPYEPKVETVYPKLA